MDDIPEHYIALWIVCFISVYTILVIAPKY